MKYVRFFSDVKVHLAPRKDDDYFYGPPITIEIYIHNEDNPIVEMYPEMDGLEGLSVYVYQSE